MSSRQRPARVFWRFTDFKKGDSRLVGSPQSRLRSLEVDDSRCSTALVAGTPPAPPPPGRSARAPAASEGRGGGGRGSQSVHFDGAADQRSDPAMPRAHAQKADPRPSKVDRETARASQAETDWRALIGGRVPPLGNVWRSKR